MVRAPRGFPEFSELDQALQIYLREVTLRVIREEVSDTSEAQDVPEALLPKNQAATRIGDACQQFGDAVDGMVGDTADHLA
jgi:hypothetical protein